MTTHLYWGNPSETDYDIVLDHFSGTKINSVHTSSIPLAQYWKDTNNRLQELFNELQLSPAEVRLHFEYPTKSIPRAKASMTDLMIITDTAKIAIEAKYTEYKKPYELVENWSKNRKRPEDALQHWKYLLQGHLNNPDIPLDKIPYQFLHRSASACNGSHQVAFVIYQLFYDREDDKDFQRFVHQIETSIKILSPNDRLKYVLMYVQVTKSPRDISMSDVFSRMKTKNVYEFGKAKYVFPR
ncbi:MAG TPA: hypothetical protein VMU30_03430 [Bacteroidota bacterium]|nr:hypothetical protein [Bacteroidota bacterium]